MKGLFSLFKVFKALFSLNVSQILMLFNQRLKGNLTIDKWLEFFKKIEVISVHVPSGHFFLKISIRVFNVFFIVFFGLIFLPLDFLEADSIETLITVLYGLLCILLVVYVMYWILNCIKVENHFSKFILPLVVILKEEVHPRSSLELQANLGQGKRRANYLKKTTNFIRTPISYFFQFLLYIYSISMLLSIPLILVYAWYQPSSVWNQAPSESSGSLYALLGVGSPIVWFIIFGISVSFGPKYPRVFTKIYQNNWLSFKVRLADKSVVDCQIEEIINQIKVVKKNPRGKIKTKHKSKSAENYILKLTLQSGSYDFDSQAKYNRKSPYALRKIPGETRNQVRQKGKVKFKNTQQTPDLQYFLKMVGNAYRQVKKTT